MHGLLEALKTGTVDTVNEERKILGMRNVSSDSLAWEAHFMSQGRCDGGRGASLAQFHSYWWLEVTVVVAL